jgi:hypothetical protein
MAAALLVRWKRHVFGEEAKALQLFRDLQIYLEQQRDHGQIESYELYLAEPHAGDMNRLIIVKGDLFKLEEIRQTEEWKDLMRRCEWLLEEFGIVGAVYGEEVRQETARFIRVTGS